MNQVQELISTTLRNRIWRYQEAGHTLDFQTTLDDLVSRFNERIGDRVGDDTAVIDVMCEVIEEWEGELKRRKVEGELHK